MKILHINVANKIATYASRDGDVVCGNSDYVIKFAFDSEWDSYSEKTARFIWNGMYEDVNFTGSECPVPILRNTSSVSIGVYAGDLSTTTPATVGCKSSILCGTAIAQPEQVKEYRDEAGVSAEQAKAYAEQAKQYRDEMGLVENRLDSRIDHNEKRITNLEQQTNPSPFYTDDTTVYAKEVPARACPYAQIDKLGTMGFTKSKNVLSGAWYDLYADGDGETVSSEGRVDYITIYGKIAKGDTIEITPDDTKYFTNGNQIVVNGIPDGFRAELNIEVNDGDWGLYFDITNNTPLTINVAEDDDEPIYNMYIYSLSLFAERDIVIGDSIDPDNAGDYLTVSLDAYISSASKVTALEMQGANVIPFPYAKEVGSTTVVSGVSFTVLEDGGIHIVGTPTTGTSYALHTFVSMPESPFVAGKTYTLSGGQRNIYLNVRTYTDDPRNNTTQWIQTESTGKAVSKEFPSGVKVSQIGIYINPALAGTYIDTVIYAMLNEGSVAYPYGKYCRGTHILWKIPEALQSLEDYGKEGAYIDFERKVLIYGENETKISEHLPDDNLFEIEGAKSISAVNEGNTPVSSSITYMLKEN